MSDGNVASPKRVALSPAQTMAELSISRATLDRYVNRGLLQPRRLPSGHRRFDRREVDRLKRAGK